MIDEGLSLLSDYGEIALDSVLEDGILKDIPIVGTVFSGIKITKEIRDRLFLMKLKKFIENIDGCPNWKDKFKDEEECERVSKRILYLIESSNDDDKIKLTAILFNLYVKEKISREEFYFLSETISNSYIPYLLELGKINMPNDGRFLNDGTICPKPVLSHLRFLGLFEYSGATMGILNDDKVTVSPGVEILIINEYGYLLRQVLQQTGL